jgi:hypothetical protein
MLFGLCKFIACRQSLDFVFLDPGKDDETPFFTISLKKKESIKSDIWQKIDLLHRDNFEYVCVRLILSKKKKTFFEISDTNIFFFNFFEHF